jgi:hypothetical protein
LINARVVSSEYAHTDHGNVDEGIGH